MKRKKNPVSQLSLYQTLYLIVEDGETPMGRLFGRIINTLIVVALVLFILETIPEFAIYRPIFGMVEKVVVIFFSLEYLLRLTLSKNRLGYLFSFYGMVDLLAIAPFYLTMGGVDMVFVRILRLFRILKIFEMTRYSLAIERLKQAFRETREELTIFFVVISLLLFIAAAGVYLFEHEVQPEKFQTIFHALWWAVITLTTVGYGDIYPVTMGGKFFTSIVLILGLIIVAVPAGLLSASLTRHHIIKHFEKRKHKK